MLAVCGTMEMTKASENERGVKNSKPERSWHQKMSTMTSTSTATKVSSGYVAHSRASTAKAHSRRVNFCVIRCSRATARSSGRAGIVCVGIIRGEENKENKIDHSTMRYIQMYSLLKPRCTERAREPRTRRSFWRSSRRSRVTRSTNARFSEMDVKRTTLPMKILPKCILASRANLNEERLSEENVLPLVKLLVLEYKAHFWHKREAEAMPIPHAARDVQRY